MPTESIPTPSDSELAEKLLREAAALALAIRAKGLESLRAGRQIKANAADFATAADHAAEEFIYKQLRLARPEVQIIASEPSAAAMLSGHEWKPHKIQGWTPDLIPNVLNREVAHRILTVDDTVARDTARLLAQKEGIFAGISAGATLASALEIAAEAKPGSVILAMLPDTGERYLSTFLFEGVNEGSDDEWLASLG